MIIAILSGKASAGKTTTAINLGAALHELGHAVQLVDLDAEQKDLSELAAAVGLPVQSTLPAKEQVSKEYVLIECTRLYKMTPDGLRLVESTRDALRIARIALIPTPCEFLTMRGLGRAVEAVRGAQRFANPELQLRAFATMYYARQQSKTRAALAATYGDEFLSVAIPRETAISAAPAHGQSVLEYSPDSRGAKAYRRLAKLLSS